MRSFHLLAAAGIAMTACSPASAALPPNHQRVAELSAILADPGVVGAFVSQPIDRVEYIRPDLYRVSAGACHIHVAIVDKPTRPGLVGARQFAVKPSKKICP